MNPTNDPKPDLKAILNFCPDINSPTTAPRNGPAITENGPINGVKIKIPNTIPNILPRTPAFVPPNL